MITYEYDLDVTPGGVPVCVNLSQYDENYELIFNLFSSKGTLKIEDGTTARIRGTKKDGAGYSADVVIAETSIVVSGNKQMTAIAGKHPYEIKLESEGKELNTANFWVYVERAPLDKDTVKSESVIKELENAEEVADEIIKNAEKTKTDIEKLVKTTEDFKDQAGRSEAAAAGSADEAKKSEGKAQDYAALAESFARGGTGIREGEETDNGKAYAEKAKAEYERAKTEADRANIYADFVTPELLLQNNRLYMRRGGTINLIVGNNRMYVKIVQGGE